MSTLRVVVFADDSMARAGAQELRMLHAEGAVTLYALAVVGRLPGAQGLTIREPLEESESAAAPMVGAAIGALVSLLGGPVTAAARTVSSGLIGAVRDLAEAGLDAGFLERVSRRLRPGGGAVVTETEEESPLPLEARMLELGGRVLRHGHGAAPEEFVTREVEALRSSLASLCGGGNVRDHAAATRAVWRSRTEELGRSLKQARLMARALRREAAAKVAVLRNQAMRLEGEARASLENRAGSVRACLESRASRLDRMAEDVAWPPHPSPSSSRGRSRSQRGEF